MDILDLVIIGAGPGGITSAIYSARAGLSFEIFEKEFMGGLITHTMDLENYPGFPEEQTGMDLMEKFYAQLEHLGKKVINTSVTEVIKENNLFKTTTSKGDYYSKALIVATGSSIKKINAEGEEKLIGRGISYCATCDGPLYRGKNIAVVGTGNSGIQEGLFLLKFVNHIDFIEVLPHIIAEKILQERIQKHENAVFHLGHRILRFEGEDYLTGIVVAPCLCDPVSKTLISSGSEKLLPVDGAFIFIGYDPNTALFRDFLKLDAKGYIISDEHDLSTSVSGLFAVGDVRQKALRQVATAVGDGALAVHSVQLYLESL